MGTIGADCSRVARATTLVRPPQPHGWVRLGLKVSRFPHFWGGGSEQCPGSLGCGVPGLFSSIIFSTSLNKKKLMCLLAIDKALSYGCSFVTHGHPESSVAGDITIIWNDVLK